MNTADKLREYLRGERDWDQREMARECLDAIEQTRVDGYWEGINEAKEVYGLLKLGA